MTQINDPKLLPCPFCGEDAAIWYYPASERLNCKDSYYVGCTNDNCGCEMEHSGGWKTYEDAVNAWNRRAKALEQEPCEDVISRKSIKQKLQEHHDFFVNAYGGFSNLPLNDKSRVDEITNCIAMVVNEPPVTPQEPRKGYLSIEDVMLVFDDFMCGEVDEDGTKTFLEMLKDKAETEDKR